MRLLSKPVEKTFEITDEKYGDWSVTFCQATEAVFEALAGTEAHVNYLYDEQGVYRGIQRERNLRKRARILVYHTLVSATGFQNDDGVEQVKSATGDSGLLRVKHAMTEPEFSAVWGLLPTEVADRIYKMCIEVNPNLDPNG